MRTSPQGKPREIGSNKLDKYLNVSDHELISAKKKKKQTPWSESASELYRPSDCRLSVKLVPSFEDRGCHVVSATDPCGRILGILDRKSYFFYQVVPQLCSRG
jgi:hypothetical protein